MDSRILFTVLVTLAGSVFACSDDSKSNRKATEDAAGPAPDTTVVTDDVEGGSLPGIDWALVKFDFVHPNDPEDITGTSVAVEVAHNLPPIATWSLFYNKSFKSTEGGIAIAENQKSDVKKLTWDISTLDPGNYFLFAVVKYGDVQNIRFLSSAVPVEDTVGDNRTPFMSLVNANTINAQVRAPGAQQTLQFIGVDPDGDDVTYGLEYSADDGTTWVSIFKDLAPDATVFTPDPVVAGQLSYAWTIPASLTRGARYRLRLTGKDNAGKTGEAVTEKFGIAATQVTFANEMRTLFAAKCVSCHGTAKEPNPDAGLRLDYLDRPLTTPASTNTRNAASNRTAQIIARTITTTDANMRMPRGGTLTQAELDLLQLWQWGNFGRGLAQPNVTIPAPPANPVQLTTFGIAYTPTDTDTANVTATVQYRLNNTGNYIDICAPTVVAQGVAQNCDWSVPAVAADTPATIRVVVDDGTGSQRNNVTRNVTILQVAP